jgi:hypothetical protein
MAVKKNRKQYKSSLRALRIFSASSAGNILKGGRLQEKSNNDSG